MNKIKIVITVICFFSFINIGMSQDYRWQQKINYTIDVEMDVERNLINGVQKMEYWNNSPDTLHRLFFHLYWNAFQPNSSMDVRSREMGKISIRNDRAGNPISEWDSRVRDRISKLNKDEIGYSDVAYVKVNGKKQKTILHETILEVVLDKPLLPKTKLKEPVKLELAFKAQVPVQIRRSGRDNAEGIKFSMSQWYPKMAQYDEMGWHANQYIGREFYGVFGNFDVKITIDKDYMVAATGVLMNANEIGMGYTPEGHRPPRPVGKTLTWHFKAGNVHDFVWAADPSYVHYKSAEGQKPVFHVFYKAKDAVTDSAWRHVLWSAEQLLPYMEKRFGKYPWPVYSLIQGGDGGMEYAMATLLKGPGIGTVVHEMMHSWYQMLLGINESLYPWMDEGFTNYGTDEVMYYYKKHIAPKAPYLNDAQKAAIAKEFEKEAAGMPLKQFDNYDSYFMLAKSNFQEPLTTHADHYNTNTAYSISSYSKGAVFLNQLGYIVGDSMLNKILHAFYNEYKFRHPNANDFIRVAEKQSGLLLQWYKQYWIETVKTIDYAISNVNEEKGNAVISLKRIGTMPMPVDVLITFKDGTKELHYIPLDLMFGVKEKEGDVKRINHEAWRWTHPEYLLKIERPVGDIKEIDIDATQRMADIIRSNNKLVVP